MSMDPKNKRALMLLAAVSGVFIIGMLVLGVGRGGNKGGDLKSALRSRDEFSKKLADYQAIGPMVDDTDKLIDLTPADYDLFGALGKIEEEAGVKEKIRSKTKDTGGGSNYFTETSVTLDLRQLSLEQLVSLLQKIEAIGTTQAFVRVSQLSVKRNFTKDERSLDVTVKVTQYGRLTGAAP
jgi:hypothetical protein